MIQDQIRAGISIDNGLRHKVGREGLGESGPEQGQNIYDSPQFPWTTGVF